MSLLAPSHLTLSSIAITLSIVSSIASQFLVIVKEADGLVPFVLFNVDDFFLSEYFFFNTLVVFNGTKVVKSEHIDLTTSLMVSSIESLFGRLFDEERDDEEDEDGGGGDTDDTDDAVEQDKLKEDEEPDDVLGPLKLSRSLLVLISEAVEDEILLPL